MKNKIPFDLFGKKQELCFTILTIKDFELAMGKGIQQVLQSQDSGVNFCLNALPICLESQSQAFYAEKIGEYIQNDGHLDDISLRIVHAIFVSGIMPGKLSDSVMAIYHPELYPASIEESETKNE